MVELTSEERRCSLAEVRMMDMKDFPRNLPEFDAYFSSEAACVAYLMGVRWPEGWRCGGCGARRG